MNKWAWFLVSLGSLLIVLASIQSVNYFQIVCGIVCMGIGGYFIYRKKGQESK